MNRSLFYVAGGILLATALALIVIAMTLPAPKSNAGEIRLSLERLSSSTALDVASFRADVQGLAGNLGQARSVVGSVANERTLTPGTNALTAQLVGAADDRREQRLRPIEQQLGVLSQQLVDLQQRATSIEIRIQDAIRDLSTRISEAAKQSTGKPASLEVAIALIGIVSSLVTLGVAVHKERRESSETRLKILELEQKIAHGAETKGATTSAA